MTMKQFQFADFVSEFYVPFIAFIPSEGHYDDYGEWIEGGETPVQTGGIVLPLSEDDLRYAEGGTYTTKDKKLYVTIPFTEGQKIEYKGDKYTIQNFKDYSEYSDIYIYYMRMREK